MPTDKLDEMIRTLKEADDLHEEVPLEELLTEQFMRKYTKFSTIEEMFEKGGFKVESEADFEAIDEAALDRHVAENTRFPSWEEMLGTAVEDYEARKLGL